MNPPLLIAALIPLLIIILLRAQRKRTLKNLQLTKQQLQDTEKKLEKNKARQKELRNKLYGP